MTKRLVSVIIAFVLVAVFSSSAFADIRTHAQIAEDEARIAAIVAEAAAEIAARQAVFPASNNHTASRAEINPEVEMARRQIEERFGILIRYDVDEDGSAIITTGTLASLDIALSNLTPSFVRQVSDYWERRVGRRLSYNFIYSPHQRFNPNTNILGSFDMDTASIYIYFPITARGFTMTGESPFTYLHEFAHAYHLMLEEKIGAEQLQRQWTALNAGHSYNFASIPEIFDDTVWITAYASTRFVEDFCEVFAHAFWRTRPGQGISHRLTDEYGNQTPLGSKVRYLEQLLPRYLNDMDEAVQNFRRVYTAPTSFYYGGLHFSGDYMQFSGLAAPRFLLRSLLHFLEIDAQSSRWVTELGGWEVVSTAGDLFVIFPGGAWANLNRAAA